MEVSLHYDQLCDRGGQVNSLSDPSGRRDRLKFVGPTFRMSGSRTEPAMLPRPVGVQKAAILRGLGLANAEVEALCVAGLFGAQRKGNHDDWSGWAKLCLLAELELKVYSLFKRGA